MAWGRDSFAEVTGECQCGSTDWLRRVRAVEAGVRETCKCGSFKEMTRWTKMRTIVNLCSREGGGAGAKYLVMRGEGAETGAEAARGGAGRGGGGG